MLEVRGGEGELDPCMSIYAMFLSNIKKGHVSISIYREREIYVYDPC